MNKKKLTKDSITGAVFRYGSAKLGNHWMDGEEVIWLALKSDKDSNASYHSVIDLNTAYELKHQLDRLLDIQMRNWAKNQLVNH